MNLLSKILKGEGFVTSHVNNGILHLEGFESFEEAKASADNLFVPGCKIEIYFVTVDGDLVLQETINS